MATIGANITKLRRQKEMTQEELASIIGVSAQSARVCLGGKNG